MAEPLAGRRRVRGAEQRHGGAHAQQGPFLLAHGQEDEIVQRDRSAAVRGGRDAEGNPVYQWVGPGPQRYSSDDASVRDASSSGEAGRRHLVA